MAIHFNYIKGLNGNVTKLSENATTTDSDDLYTFIKWAGRNQNESPNNKDAKYLPHIYVERTNALGSNDLGSIITSHAVNQTFYNKYIFLKGHTDTAFKIGLINAVNAISDDPYLTTVTLVNNEPKYGCSVDLTGLQLFYSYDNNGSGETTKELLIVNVPTFENHAFTKFDGYGQNTKDSNYSEYVDYNAWFTKSIKIDEHVDALYFNATSDQRAKSHIKLLKSNALDIVNKLPIYEFHYRNNDAPSIGVLAQDAITFDEQFTDFSLVDNPNATGENGDYMTVKESKLVYILWKAVQEQQAQINYLQAELNELKESW